MCYYVSSQLTRKEIKNVFGADTEETDFVSSGFINGFSHPLLPIIYDESPMVCKSGKWGLIPSWAKDAAIAKSTLNARIETLEEKPSFKKSVVNRCLILVDGFYEWKWQDTLGKNKVKHLIQLDNSNTAFALAGIYEHSSSDQISTYPTFSIVTTSANELMATIHNTKYRMPVVLDTTMQKQWLKGADLLDFSFPVYDPKLKAFPLI